MMRFEITVRYESPKDGETAWREAYDKPVGRIDEHWEPYHPANALRGNTLEAVIEWGKAIVAWYNRTLRPGERKMKFVSALLLNDQTTGRIEHLILTANLLNDGRAWLES